MARWESVVRYDDRLMIGMVSGRRASLSGVECAAVCLQGFFFRVSGGFWMEHGAVEVMGFCLE